LEQEEKVEVAMVVMPSELQKNKFISIQRKSIYSNKTLKVELHSSTLNTR
jgi:hypothetical protein